MMKSASKYQKQILEYTLTDYEFLEDYQIIDSHPADKFTFIAQIKNSAQKVRFIKKVFTEQLFPRFKALCKLYKSGIVLADNMFMIEECDQYYFYIIEAELEHDNPRFRSLQHYLYQEKPSHEERTAIVSKIKILVDCLHQEGQTYAGLDVRNIIVDDQNHIYLAPFQLQLQLRTDIFSTAYYPPELLSSIQQECCEINEITMAKWDFWSFGCIACQVMLFSSPLFLETSNEKQIKKIKHFSFNDQLSTLEEPMRNVIANSLNKDPIQRNMATTQIIRSKNMENQLDLKKTVKSLRRHNYQANTEEMTELNIYKDSEVGDSELKISFLTLENIQIKDQLHLAVSLGKRYHFYLDHTADTIKYRVNKLITIRNNFAQIAKLLQNPIKVEMKEGNYSTIIFLNLQSLVIMHQGRRLWNKELLGTYKASKDSDCPTAKLKVSCILNSPDFYVQENPKIEPKQQQSQTPLDISSFEPGILTEVTNYTPKIKKKREKAGSKSDIPSISDISKSISCITEHFMKKLASKEQPNQHPVSQETL